MTERESLVGKMSLVSRLPQYLDQSQHDVKDRFDLTDLIQAMLTGADAVAWKYLDMVMTVVVQERNVERCGSIYVFVSGIKSCIVPMWLCSTI